MNLDLGSGDFTFGTITVLNLRIGIVQEILVDGVPCGEPEFTDSFTDRDGNEIEYAEALAMNEEHDIEKWLEPCVCRKVQGLVHRAWI